MSGLIPTDILENLDYTLTSIYSETIESEYTGVSIIYEIQNKTYVYINNITMEFICIQFKEAYDDFKSNIYDYSFVDFDPGLDYTILDTPYKSLIKYYCETYKYSTLESENSYTESKNIHIYSKLL